MSTRVRPEEYATLTNVAPKLWRGSPLMLCDVQPQHGHAVEFMQTPDHRAIALCDACRREVIKAKQAKVNALGAARG